jgi:hypothetical protein
MPEQRTDEAEAMNQQLTNPDAGYVVNVGHMHIWACSALVERLLSMQKALGSIPS